MRASLSGLIPPELAADAAREGLPYWTFWLLLCVIVLLLFFIFLRDKDLRHRLSAFLSGAKRRMLRLRLQAKIKRERERKLHLRRELGRKAWSEDVQLDCAGEICGRLKLLTEEATARRLEWHGLYSRIESLGRTQEDGRRRQAETAAGHAGAARPLEEKLKNLENKMRQAAAELEHGPRRLSAAEAQIRSAEADIRAATEKTRLSDEERTARHEKARARIRALLAEQEQIQARRPALETEKFALEAEAAGARAELATVKAAAESDEAAWRAEAEALDKEIRELEHRRNGIQERLVELDRLSEPLYESFGKLLEESRPAHPELALVYFQIDAVEKSIAALQDRIDNLL